MKQTLHRLFCLLLCAVMVVGMIPAAASAAQNEPETFEEEAPNEAPTLVKDASALSGIKIEGLMTIAPYTEDPESNRPYFAGLRELAVDIGQKCIDNVSMSVLSMGMTGDFEVAIEEGATHIRVGTGIFGERIYT